MKYLYHIARLVDWEQAKHGGVYRVSSLHRSFDDDGFIHLSYAKQVSVVADAIYRETADLVLLKVDPRKLTSEVKVERAELINDAFPHLYGALNLDAVVDVRPYILTQSGTFPVVTAE